MYEKVYANYMSVEDAAKFLGRSYKTILNWIKKGRLTDVIEVDGWSGRPAYYISREQLKEVKERIESGEKRYKKIIRITIDIDEPEEEEDIVPYSDPKQAMLDAAMAEYIRNMARLRCYMDSLRQ